MTKYCIIRKVNSRMSLIKMWDIYIHTHTICYIFPSKEARNFGRIFKGFSAKCMEEGGKVNTLFCTERNEKKKTLDETKMISIKGVLK